MSPLPPSQNQSESSDDLGDEKRNRKNKALAKKLKNDIFQERIDKLSKLYPTLGTEMLAQLTLNNCEHDRFAECEVAKLQLTQ